MFTGYFLCPLLTATCKIIWFETCLKAVKRWPAMKCFQSICCWKFKFCCNNLPSTLRFIDTEYFVLTLIGSPVDKNVLKKFNELSVGAFWDILILTHKLTHYKSECDRRGLETGDKMRANVSFYSHIDWQLFFFHRLPRPPPMTLCVKFWDWSSCLCRHISQNWEFWDKQQNIISSRDIYLCVLSSIRLVTTLSRLNGKTKKSSPLQPVSLNISH